MDKFEDELASLLNRYSKENGSDTPDWMLASYLNLCLEAYNTTLQAREKWYGRGPKIVEGGEVIT